MSVVWWFIPMCRVAVSAVRPEIEVPAHDGTSVSTVTSCNGSEGRPPGAFPAPSQLVIVWHALQSLLPFGGCMKVPPSRPTPATGKGSNGAPVSWQVAQLTVMPA